MIDPDTSAEFGNEEKPYAHWLVTNIPFGNISAGETVLQYRGSLPPYGQDHLYQFFLVQSERESRCGSLSIYTGMSATFPFR